MQIIKFLTYDKNTEKYTCWCTTNQLQMFIDFSQYILDSCSKPEDYKILDTSTNKLYSFLPVIEQYGMHKRTFEQRNNKASGKFYLMKGTLRK